MRVFGNICVTEFLVITFPKRRSVHLDTGIWAGNPIAGLELRACCKFELYLLVDFLEGKWLVMQRVACHDMQLSYRPDECFSKFMIN